eukprot:813013_1
MKFIAIIVASAAVVSAKSGPSLRGPALDMAVKETAEEYFFPKNSENFIDEDEEKERSASKRQRQRDVRRSYDNPNRTAQEDANEGRRKRTQHARSGRGRPDIDQEGGRRREGG